MKKKKIVIFGGGSGLSCVLKGLKTLPVEITAVVSVSDNGSSTGRLRKEFSIPAVGDLRKVVSSLSSLPEDLQDIMENRFVSKTELGGHAIGNLLLTCLLEKTHSLKKSIDYMCKLLDVKHKVLPISEDYLTLMGETVDGKIIEGEEDITQAQTKFIKIFYKEKPHVLKEVIDEIKQADLLILSAGSLLTSLVPNIICKEVVDAIKESQSKLMYICNLVTQAGETDHFTVNDHAKFIEQFLDGKKLDVIVVNNTKIDEFYVKKYKTEEQKDIVKIDYDILQKSSYELLEGDLITDEDGSLKHDTLKLSSIIFAYLMR